MSGKRKTEGGGRKADDRGQTAYSPCQFASKAAEEKKVMRNGVFQMEARLVHRGPAVTIFGETYYSEKLWPYLNKHVYFFTVQAGQEKISIYTADKEFICNVEKKKPITYQEHDWTEFRGLDELQKQLDRIERLLNAMKTVRPVESWQSFLKRQPQVVHALQQE